MVLVVEGVGRLYSVALEPLGILTVVHPAVFVHAEHLGLPTELAVSDYSSLVREYLWPVEGTYVVTMAHMPSLSSLVKK